MAIELRLTISVFNKALEQEIIRGRSDHVPALVASFSVGSRVIVTLSSQSLTVHTPAVFLSWQGGDETLTFRVSLPADATLDSSLNACLELFNEDGLCLGAIDYSVACKATPRTNREISRQELSVYAWNKVREGRELKYIRTLRYKNVFFSYVREDLERITVLATGLQMNGTNVVMDRTAWWPDGKSWFDKLQLELAKKPDAIFIAWSASSSEKYSRGGAEPIYREINHILDIANKPHITNKPRIVIYDISSTSPKLPDAFGDLRSSTMTSQFTIIIQSERYKLAMKQGLLRHEDQNIRLPT